MLDIVASRDRFGPAVVLLQIGGDEGQFVEVGRPGLRQRLAHRRFLGQLRTVVRTVCPAASNCRMTCPPTNPDPPVTRTLLMIAPLAARTWDAGRADGARIALAM